MNPDNNHNSIVAVRSGGSWDQTARMGYKVLMDLMYLM